MVEFRLYYDDDGKVVCYTCDKLPGKYIVIDANTFAATDHTVRIVDGVIHKASEYVTISRLVESDEGISCEVDDICIITEQTPNKKWKIERNEYRNS